MTSKRIRSIEEVEAIKAQIVALVEAGPKTAAEISKAVGIKGNSLGYYFTMLLRAGAVSRQQLSKDRFLYHIGQTAPDTPHKPGTTAQKAERKRMKYAVPVRKVIVRPFSIAGENGTSAEVTLPAAPWEVAA